jgi:hypothetical protein
MKNHIQHGKVVSKGSWGRNCLKAAKPGAGALLETVATMTPYNRRLVVGTFEILDLGLLTFALFAAASAPLLFSKAMGAFTAFFTLRVKVVNVVLYILLLVVWHVILTSFRLYESKRLTDRRGEISETLKAVAVLCHGCLCAQGRRSISSWSPDEPWCCSGFSVP